MKKNLISILMILLFISCTTTPKMTLVWSEEFDGTTLNDSIWSKIPRGGSDWNNYMSSYDSLYAVRDGNLILRGVVNHTQKEDTARFLTGGVYTKDKRVFGLGCIEIRAKLGAATGYWPAFWMLPATAEWPNGGEIDIMEHLNHDSVVYQTLHSNYTLKHGIKNPKPGTVPRYHPGEYNVYAMEKHLDSICMYVNGLKTLTYNRLDSVAGKDQFPFCDEPYYLLLDSQLGGGWVGGIVSEELPVEMQIDWVKFYEAK